MLVFAFGNWFLLVPVFAISTVVFFAAGSPESLKTVLGTIYLILFVLTTLGYLTLQIFGITSNFFEVNLDLRSPRDDYLYSPNKTYRLVTYIDKENVENRTISFFVEFTGDDITLPFLEGERHRNSRKILTQRLASRTHVEWLDDSKLFIDGKVKDVSVDASEIEEEPDNDFTNETAILTPSPTMTQATTTPPPTEPAAP
jgi:hypothetical protein